MPDWPGVICLACRAESDFDKDGDNMGVWCYLDFPECSLIQLYCKHCKQSSNIYLGEKWDQDVQYLLSTGLGCIVADNAPMFVRRDYRAVRGYDPLSTYQLSEIGFFAHLLSNQYDEWWIELSAD